MAEVLGDDGGGRQKKILIDYPSNSVKNKTDPLPAANGTQEEKERPAKAIAGDAKVRKKGLVSRLSENWFSDDIGTVVNYVVMDVLLPAAKNMVSDAVSQGIERMLFGDARPRSSRPGYTNYGARSSTPAGGRVVDPRPPLSRQARANHDFSDIILTTRTDAENTLERLRDIIQEYRMATVADLYDLVGLTGVFTDNKWGWEDLRSASIRPVRGGYILNLPRTIALD